MNKIVIILLSLLFFANVAWRFGNFKKDYYKALEGHGKASNGLCSWFEIYTDGQIFDDNGKQLDTSVTKIDQFCLNVAEKGFASAQWNAV